MTQTDQPPQANAADFWRRTPPAVFPSLFGALGLGLAFRAAARWDGAGVAVPPVIGEIILAVGAFLYLFALACYLSKLSYRPGVLFEDIATPPGRAGAATMSLSLFLMGAAVVPYAPAVAAGFLWVGLVGHFVMAICAILVMARQPQGLKVSPVWHLSFVGFIIAPLVAIPLGYAGFAQAILGVTLLIAALIYGVSLLQLGGDEVPAPARPLLMVHLAPLSLFATVSYMLGQGWLSLGFVVMAVGVGAVLLSRVLWLTAAGFSPLWGAFTFPVVALSSALFAASGHVMALGYLALLPLAIGVLVIPVIVLRILVMWAKGVLAAKTGAGIA